MDFLKENAILKLNLDVLVLQKGATKSGRYESQRDFNTKLQIIARSKYYHDVRVRGEKKSICIVFIKYDQSVLNRKENHEISTFRRFTFRKNTE